MSKQKDIEVYINEVSLFHNFYYDYTLVKYKNAHTKIKILCPIHGEFKQTPINHRRYGCQKCGKLLQKKDILDRFGNIHNGKYTYTNFNYSGMSIKSNITCLVLGDNGLYHGDFEQTPINHLAGKGCPKCATNFKKNEAEIVKKLNILHNYKYDYSASDFKRTKDNITIICPKHKDFVQVLNNHLRGCGCPFCDESKGEREIERYLIENNIKYERQKKFELCRDKRKLPFDFYLVDYNICIEYDGEHHFNEILKWNNFEYTKNHDLIKNNYCIKNNIPLYRITYKENIIEKLEIYLKVCQKEKE